MTIRQFSLVKVEVYPTTDTDIRKILLPGTFVFDKSTHMA